MSNNYRTSEGYIKQRLEYVSPVDYISELEEQIENLQIEKEDYKSRCDKIENNCKKSIEAINKKLESNKEPYEVIDGKLIYLNEYQEVTLKAIRMKCKELLNILGDEE